MKKLILLSIILSACGQPRQTDVKQFNYGTKYVSDYGTYTVIEIDSCEYIRCSTSYGGSVLVHKGNCKNPIHIK